MAIRVKKTVDKNGRKDVIVSGSQEMNMPFDLSDFGVKRYGGYKEFVDENHVKRLKGVAGFSSKTKDPVVKVNMDTLQEILAETQRHLAAEIEGLKYQDQKEAYLRKRIDMLEQYILHAVQNLRSYNSALDYDGEIAIINVYNSLEDVLLNIEQGLEKEEIDVKP
jgi:exonuclease III